MVLGAMGISIPLFALAAIFAGIGGGLAPRKVLVVAQVALSVLLLLTGGLLVYYLAELPSQRNRCGDRRRAASSVKGAASLGRHLRCGTWPG